MVGSSHLRASGRTLTITRCSQASLAFSDGPKEGQETWLRKDDPHCRSLQSFLKLHVGDLRADKLGDKQTICPLKKGRCFSNGKHLFEA